MDYSSLIKSVSLLLGVIGGLFAIYKFYRRDEHFPRVQFDVEINFVGKEDDKHVVEIVAYLDNKGVVPIKLTELEFSLRGLKSGEPLEEGDNKINKQLKLPHKIKDAPWIADMWEHTFVYPGVRTRYTHAAIVDDKYNYLLVRGLFIYESDEKFHTSAKLVKVPNQSIQ
ncbi:hypothetical protein [Pseudoalteromonas sp. Of7M-16]|uniref:hypothetical protein n=1 Tax=Pseudoalteromonas sp. Of7M-16 TaxID=2917756 RepID=UPI001EF5C1FA|nr:hypothetical protein [Pseudoalteromonas sp. Of7M-16]MCG7549324.1 hypothetical protein [Pseudoalteromonas sp. Of7M-16]